MTSLFGTSGIRGSAKELFTNQFCFDAGRAFAIFLKRYQQKGKVAVGMDSRQSSKRIKIAFSKGVQKEGYKVIDQGILPVPAVNYILIANHSFAGSCMVTGSHIRSDFNGLKFFAFKEEILKKQEREIEKNYQKIKNKVIFPKGKLKLKRESQASKFYRNLLLTLADSPYPKWRVIIDGGNGCQSKMIPDFLRELGLKVKTINCKLRLGKFVPRDTETEETVRELQKKVKKEKTDFGIAFDVDGDRVVFVDEKGNFVTGDYIGALISKYGNTPKVVTPINTSQVVNYLGKPVIRTKVGSPYVVETMKKYGATFGFEANGGGFSAEIMMSRDAGSSTIKILNLLKQNGKTLEELVNTLPQFFLYRTKVECPRELNQAIIKEVRKNFNGIKVEEIDGLKIWVNRTKWILFRPSSNAPEFRVFAEAKTKEKAKKLGEKGINFVKSLIK